MDCWYIFDFVATCQMRVVRVYVCWSSPPPQPSRPSPPRRTSTASAWSQWSPGPDQQTQDQNGPRRTSTASAWSQWSLPDPNSKPRIRAFPAGPQPQRISEDIPNRIYSVSRGNHSKKVILMTFWRTMAVPCIRESLTPSRVLVCKNTVHLATAAAIGTVLCVITIVPSLGSNRGPKPAQQNGIISDL